ncbi:MAG: DedA family protein [Parachlamydiaceae bacterium]
MAETLVSFACEHAHSAHWIFFLLLMLAGMSLPISEDIILLTGGAIASTCIPNETLYLYLWIYAGCWISAWEAYGIGRYLGPKLYEIRWFRYMISPEKIQRLHHYYEKFGVWTFVVGRFIPGGVRNALFMTAGLGKMPFLTFILRDGFALCISSSTIFYIGYSFGENYQTIIHFMVTYNKIAAVCILILASAAILLLSWRYYNKQKAS